MKLHVHALLCCGALSAPALAADAADETCFSFSAERQTFYRGGQQLLIRDDGRHFRLNLAGGKCGAIPAAAKLRLSTQGEADVLCAGPGKVSARSGSCRVASIEEIDADTFALASRGR
ncbi:hypothetical protein [Pseudomarimonas salicorniae]|uniref:Uncharacterized protein n=1 Tax=Pseudomarimonas salicorniae TaxID=2933270 RepID=A0ABT0GHY3_9GAMM|nr:hypothetical protein [Lysobacter sp. CAU 1642]MCK7594161.1 hypothetical protein [Lysobacter sp. CAU 1642]